MKLMDGEEVLMELRPERQLLVIWFFMACLGTIVGIGFLILLFMPALGGLFEVVPSAKDKFLTFWLPAILGAALLIFIVSCIYCVYLRRTYIYIITSQRCIFSGGILRRVRHSIPYHKITDVEMSQNIFERMLGISSLGIYTPGTGSIGRGNNTRPEIAYVGLKDNEPPAEVILQILGELQPTGQ